MFFLWLGAILGLFVASPRGACTSAFIYSLIESAKANDLEPKRYLNELFERYPLAVTDEQRVVLLPEWIIIMIYFIERQIAGLDSLLNDACSGFSIPSDLAPILERAGLNPDAWVTSVSHYNNNYFLVLGAIDRIKAYARTQKKSWYRGQRAILRSYRLVMA
jgi:transposase